MKRCFLAGILLLIVVSHASGDLLSLFRHEARDKKDFPSFGISVEPPKGWMRTYERRHEEVGRWIPFDRQNPKQLDAMFSLLVFFIPDESVESISKDFAEQMGCTAQPAKLKIHELPTWSLTAKNADGDEETWLCCKRGDLFYVARYLPIGERTRADIFEAFVKSIRLSDPQAPHLHLEMRNHPMTAEGADVVFDTVEPMRIMSRAPQSSTTKYEIQNYKQESVDLFMMVVARPHAGDTSLQEVRAVISAALSQNYYLEKEPEFRKVKATAEVWATDLLHGSATTEGGKTRKTISRWVVASVSKEKVIHFSFDFNTHDEKAVKAYSNAIDRMIQTIRSDKDYREGVDVILKPTATQKSE